MIQGFLRAAAEDREYDFIANHYYEMNVEDLKCILLEYIYEMQNAFPEKENVIENIKDIYEEDM